MIFDDRLNVWYHIKKFFKKPSLKLNTLSRVAPLVDLTQKIIICSVPFFSHSSATTLLFGCSMAEYLVTKQVDLIKDVYD